MAFLDGNGVTELVTKLKTKFANIVHTHSGENITTGTISASRLPTATTLDAGIVQLTSNTTSTSTTLAANAYSVNIAWEKAMYGTSSTTASTATKVVTCSDYRFASGQLIAVQFSTANTYTNGAIALNINSKGAKNVYVNGAVTSSSNTILWDAGETLLFVYTGSYYYFITKSKVSLPTASTSVLGGVKVDGSTITIADGVISAAGGGGGSTVYQINLTLNGTTVSDVNYNGSSATAIATAVVDDPTTDVVFVINAGSDGGPVIARPDMMQASYNSAWGDIATTIYAVLFMWYEEAGDRETYLLRLTYTNQNWYANKRTTL